MNDRTTNRQPWLLYVYAGLLLAIALFLTINGLRLSLLGGSPYYVIGGIVLLASGGLLFARRRLGARLYGAFLLATLVWAIWEVGFNGWQLAPRLIAPFVFGLGLLIPSVRRALHGAPMRLPAKSMVLGLAGGVCAIGLGALLHGVATPHKPADPIFQTGMGTAAPDGPAAPMDGTDRPYFGGDAGGSRFTSLDQINAGNVGRLRIAWMYRTGPDPKGVVPTMESAPIKIGDTLYSCTDYDDVFALDAETGEEKWRFRSGLDMSQSKYSHCRGVSYYRVPEAEGLCAERIFTNTLDARLLAFDAHTGALCPGFGENGTVSLLKGMGDIYQGYYNITSAPTLIRGKLVLGGMVADGQYWGVPSGVIRAFDAVTGELAWAWDMGRPDRTGEPPEGETYTHSTPNSWAPMSADEELGLVYVPTGNPSLDYYGPQRRPFDDKYGSSVVALDAETGRPRWSFQTTHHDLWDYDVPSQPTLVDVPGPDGGMVRGLIQPTKRGELFYLDRATGTPIARVEERPAPQRGKEENERLSPTQPFSVGLPSVAGPDLTERAMWGMTPLDQLWCRLDFRQSRYDGPMTPPGPTRSIFYPGYGGGSNWGSVSVDRDRNIMIVNAMRMATRARLMPREEADSLGLKRLGPGVKIDMAGSVVQEGVAYAAEISPMVSPLGMPCTPPPFGTLSAIDLRTHKLLWTQPYGTAEGSGPMGIKSGLPIKMGVPTFGGSLTTRTGLTFVAASPDGYLRAIDTRTGDEVWKTRLPVPGISTPVSYYSNASGRQFIVISAAGSASLGTEVGDYVVAFALPQEEVGQ